MFNFNVLNKAMSDPDVSDSEFRLLYLIVNTMSMKNTNELTMYNGYLMDKLNLCERQVRRLTTSLDKKGYIARINNGNSKKRTGNIIRLMGDKNIPPIENKYEANADIKLDKNVPPYKNKKEIKKTCIQVSSRKVPGTCEKNNTVNESEKKMETELKQERTHTRKEDNDYVTRCLEKFDTMLKYLYSITDMKIYDEYTNDILKFWQSIDQTRFTEKQRGLIEKKCETWVKISEGKNCYFNGKSEKTDNNDESISMDDLTEADRLILSQSEEKNSPQVAPHPPLKKGCRDFRYEEAIEWVKSTLPQYENYDSWEASITEKFNRKYGVGWDCGKDPNACRLWNIAMRYASNHYYEAEETETVSGDDLAPWETTDDFFKPGPTPEEVVKQNQHLFKG